MAKVISVINEKGGCGKTSLTLNLGVGFAKHGFKVLLVDNDPQHNLSSKLLDDTGTSIHQNVLQKLLEQSESFKQETHENELEKLLAGSRLLSDFVKVFEEQETLSLSNVLEDKMNVFNAIQKTYIEGVDVLPSTHTLSVMDSVLKTVHDRDKRLKKALDLVEKDYDVILIDNSPFESALTYNSITSCYQEGDLILIPTKMDYENWEGVSHTIRTVLDCISDFRLDCDFRIVGTMVSQTKTAKTAVQIFKNLFGERMMNTTVRYQAKPIESSSFTNNVLLNAESKAFTQSGVYQDLSNLEKEIREKILSL